MADSPETMSDLEKGPVVDPTKESPIASTDKSE